MTLVLLSHASPSSHRAFRCSTPHPPLLTAPLKKMCLIKTPWNLGQKGTSVLSAFQIVAIFCFCFPNNCPDYLFCFHFLLLLALCLQNKQASLVSKCSPPPPHLIPTHCDPLCFVFWLGPFCFCVLAAFPIRFNSGLSANARKRIRVVSAACLGLVLIS